MPKCYFELRKQAARGTTSLMADIMRHLNSRQHLGKAVVVASPPMGNLCTARKQWLKLSRVIQKQRACTINADKILKYTHSIIHMQNMRFSHKTPLEDAEADVYFLSQADLIQVPPNCRTVYITESLSKETMISLVQSLPEEALVVDYLHGHDWERLGLQPKRVLEDAATDEWIQIYGFLADHNIIIEDLLDNHLRTIDTIDDALDILMASPNKFLTVATHFHHTLENARPLRVSKDMRQRYDVVMLLAHRVQALTSSRFSKQFLESYNEDDTFFMYDTSKRRFARGEETLPEAIQRHTDAGRHNLAHALQNTAGVTLIKFKDTV